MRILYLDCFSGISGDMTLAALVDAGADREYVERELTKITLEPYTLEWKRVVKRGVSALKLDVILDPAHPPKHHRHYSEIADVIRHAGFNERVTSLALAIFSKIGAAESKIHNIPMESVHFHEVGAIDSIIDIVGVALAVDSLDVDRILCSRVPLGSGTIHIDHGTYPVPAPATLEMMKGLPIAVTHIRQELTTPTGAGIASGIVNEFSDSLPNMVVEAIGYGAGTRDLPDQPNVLRAVIGYAQDDAFLQVGPFAHSHGHTHEHHTHDDHHHHQEHDHHHHNHDHDHDHEHDHDYPHNHHHHKHEHHGHHDDTADTEKPTKH